MYKRNQTRKVFVKDLQIGGNDNIIIQSMCNIKTSNVEKVIQQILMLEKYGCELIRVSILDEDDAKAIKQIKKHIHIPLVADIHFDYKLALLCIENGVDKIRINPGNIGKIENIKAVVDACKTFNIPIRIGINSGSLEEDLKNQYGTSAKTMIESAKRHIKILEDLDFYDIVLSLKSSDFNMCVEAYKIASELFNYPLHIGITEPGTLIPGIIKSTLGLSTLLDLNIGNTIRISLSDDPIQEIKVAKQLLKAKGLIDMPSLTSCPTCGRIQYDMMDIAKEIENFLLTVNKDIHVAVMGCAVNGPGEAKAADIGIAGGKDEALLFKKGVAVRKIKNSDIVDELKKEIINY